MTFPNQQLVSRSSSTQETLYGTSSGPTESHLEQSSDGVENVIPLSFAHLGRALRNSRMLELNGWKIPRAQSSINIFIIGVEQLISSLADVEAYYNTQLAISQKGYNGYILYHPIKKDKDYLFIVDNGRSNMLNMQRQRVALNCLHCGRCAKVCPIYSVIGSEPYNNVFTGPIGNVVLPFFEDVDSYKHVSYACLLCGNCEKVCPVSIPIKDLIIENRTYFRKTKGIDIPMNSNYLAYKKFVTSRKKMNKSKILRNMLLNKILSKAFRKKRKMPPLEKKSFNKQYILSLQNENK